MGVFTYTLADNTTPVEPSRLFQAFAVDDHNLMPKIAPQYVKDAPFTYSKTKLDVVDLDNYVLHYTCSEGDAFPDTVKYAVYEDKYEQTEAGTRCTMVAHYHLKGDNTVKEEDLDKAKEGIQKMFKAVEEHLIANPQLYA